MKKQTLFFYSISALFVFLSGMYLMLYTTTGITWLLNRAIGDTSGSVSIDKLQHSFNGDYAIFGLKYVTPMFQLEISKLELAWNPLTLLRQKMEVRSFAGESISFQWQNDKHDFLTSAELPLPFIININQGSIKNLSLTLPGSFEKSFQNVKFEQLYWYDSFYTNKLIFTSSNGGAFEVSGKAGFRHNDVINLTTKAIFTIPNTTKVISSQGTIVGTPAQLKFLQQIKAPYASTVAGSVANVFENPQIDFRININSLNDETFDSYLKVKLLQGELTGNGSLSGIKMNGQLKLKDDLAKWWAISVDSSLDREKADLHIVSSLSQPGLSKSQSRVELHGEWQHQLGATFLRNVAVSGTIENLSLAVNDTSTLQVRQGSYQYNGNTLQSAFELKDLDIDSTGTHLTKLEVQTSSGDGKNIFLSGKAETAGGSLKFTGDLNKKALGYQIANLSLTGNNFALVRKPDAHIIISPELTFSRSDRSFQSSGIIKVPTANIQLQGVSETCHQLAALFFNSSQIRTTPIQITKQINLEFGKSVWLHGYGLNANVTGGLAIESLSSNNLIANGSLNVLRGNYTNHNRKYTVSGGLLKFSNKQLDNPDLELKVVEKQTASAAITSTIQGPLQTLHTAQDKAPIKHILLKDNKRIAFNDG